MNLQYGLKEVANVIFFDLETGKPAIFMDTLKVSTIENESESAEARGGQGNGKLMSWDYGRTANLALQDALLSDSTLGMMAGNKVETENIVAVGTETLTVQDGKITLSETPINNKRFSVMATSGGILTGTEVTKGVLAGKVLPVTGAKDGDKVMAFYEYTVTSDNATKVTFSADKFPSQYRVVGSTWARGRDGKDHRMQFLIPQAKLQSTFSLTMDVENVSVFDFTLEVLLDPESTTKDMYQIIRL